MKKKIFNCVVLTISIVLSSCKTPSDVTYFQGLEDGALIQNTKQLDIRIMPGDQLSILVNTQDPTLTALFNLTQSQLRLSNGVEKIGNAINSEGRIANYTVNPDGDINFPVLGELHLEGMTRSEAAKFIEKRLINDDLVKQPVVTVEFVNTGISVVGEVAKPGRYEFNKDRLSVIEAIAMAGDLKVTGQRENVMVIRNNVDGTQKVYRIDLTNGNSVASSPAYYLRQDDVIYVEPNEKSKRETTSAGNTPYTPSFWLSVGSIGLTVATLLATLLK